jgi:hypothetical protein
MIQKLFINYKWILTSDWNVVESSRDKLNVCGHLISKVKFLAWDQIKKQFNVDDGFDPMDRLKYTSNNR